jgi:hypothetical protein
VNWANAIKIKLRGKLALVEAEAVTGPGVPPPVRWVRPTVYRLIRKDASGEPGT